MAGSTPEPERESTPEREPETPWILRALRWSAVAVPWALVAATIAVGLHAVGTPAADIARFAAYWVLYLVLPGTLVFRALRGSRGNLPEDLGYGAATGLVLEAGAWAAATAYDHTAWLRLWPVPVVIAFLAIRPLRRHWRVGGEVRRLPVAWSWGMAAVLVTTTLWLVGQWQGVPLPPARASYYPDLLYHLSLVRELMHPMPFEVPQLAGEPMSYHFLSHAHMATASHISGVDPLTVVFRLWIVPIVLLGVLLVAAVARDLTGKAWTGPVAAALTLIGAPLFFGGPMPPFITSPVTPYSPSQTYVLVPLLLLTALCVDAVRERALGLGWVLLAATAVVCAGAKSSGPPLLLAGVLLAIPVSGLARRRVPWRAIAALGCLLGGLAAGFVLFVEASGGGAEIQLLSSLQWADPYRTTLGATQKATMPGPLPPGLEHGGDAAWQFALLLVLWLTISQVPLLLGLAAFAGRSTRRDPAVWMLGGGMLAGVGCLWVIFHPGAGQLFFLRSAMPLGVLGAVCLLAAVLPRRGGAIAALGGALFGIGLVVWLLELDRAPTVKPVPSMAAWLDAIYPPLLRAAGIALGAVALWWLLRTLVRPLRTRGAAVAVAGVLGASLAVGAIGVTPIIGYAINGNTPGQTDPLASDLTAAEMRAALWLDANAGPDDVIATNVHCVNLLTRPNCESRAFWVSGLSGRQVVIEGWAFVPASVELHGSGGLGYSQQPPPDWTRYALNERVFADPTPEDLRRLRLVYGARWLFADTRAGTVSPALAALTTARYTDGSVTIYELPAD